MWGKACGAIPAPHRALEMGSLAKTSITQPKQGSPGLENCQCFPVILGQ